jgi:hypothetical protein
MVVSGVGRGVDMEWGFDRRFAAGALAMSLVIALAGIGVPILWPEEKILGWTLLWVAAVIFVSWLVFETFQWCGLTLKMLSFSLLAGCLVFGSLTYLQLRSARSKGQEQGASNLPASSTQKSSPYSLKGEMDWTFLAESAPDAPAMFVVSGRIMNTGAPTVLQGWRVGLEKIDGTVLPGTIHMPIDKDIIAPIGPAKSLLARKEDYWTIIANSKALQTGDAATGFLLITLPGYTKDDVLNMGTTRIVVSVEDIAGDTYTVKSDWGHAKRGAPLNVPGSEDIPSFTPQQDNATKFHKQHMSDQAKRREVTDLLVKYAADHCPLTTKQALTWLNQKLGSMDRDYRVTTINISELCPIPVAEFKHANNVTMENDIIFAGPGGTGIYMRDDNNPVVKNNQVMIGGKNTVQIVTPDSENQKEPAKPATPQ